MENLIVRSVVPEDAEAILNIYSPYILNTAVSFEYDVPSINEFRERIKSITKKFPYLVLCKDEEILGYAYASTFHWREAYNSSVELSIYLKESCHGKGYGKFLYLQLENELRNRGFAVMYACIACSSRNPDEYLTDASIKFHEKLGFTNAGYFPNCARKFNRWYSIVYMQKNLLNEYKDDLCKKDSAVEKSDNNTSVQNNEVIDIYDNQKRITGKTICRTEFFEKNNLLRSIIHVCIFNSKNELLIQQRAESKKSGAGMWDFSASGQVLSGEVSQQGAMREVKEELGIDIIISEAPVITKIFFNSYNDYYIVRKDIDIQELKFQKSEVQNARWASRKEVIELWNQKKFLSYPQSLIELVFDVGEFKD